MAHKHKHFFPVIAWVGEGSARGQIFMCCVRNPRKIKFSSGYLAGRIGDSGDLEIVYVLNVYVPFLAPNIEKNGTHMLLCL